MGGLVAGPLSNPSSGEHRKGCHGVDRGHERLATRRSGKEVQVGILRQAAPAIALFHAKIGHAHLSDPGRVYRVYSVLDIVLCDGKHVGQWVRHFVAPFLLGRSPFRPNWAEGFTNADCDPARG